MLSIAGMTQDLVDRIQLHCAVVNTVCIDLLRVAHILGFNLIDIIIYVQFSEVQSVSIVTVATLLKCQNAVKMLSLSAVFVQINTDIIKSIPSS